MGQINRFEVAAWIPLVPKPSIFGLRMLRNPLLGLGIKCTRAEKGIVGAAIGPNQGVAVLRAEACLKPSDWMPAQGG